MKNPNSAENNKEEKNNDGEAVMDEFEWRMSFSVAENILGQSMSPVQRHIIVLLKLIKTTYLPEVICSYHLKNLLFWECEQREESFWREETSAKCLLYMLDRLQECLEERCLPQYIMPQSNLLQYEDPAQLAEAAAAVADVRRNILPKTNSMFKRLQSLSFYSNTYYLGLNLENEISKISNTKLTEQEIQQVLKSVYLKFVHQSKEVIAQMVRLKERQPSLRDNFNISTFVYLSIVTRLICKLWFIENSQYIYPENGGSTSSRCEERFAGAAPKPPRLDTEPTENEEEQFISFLQRHFWGSVQNEELSTVNGDELIPQALEFLYAGKNGKDPTLAIPETAAMLQVKETQRRMKREKVQAAMSDLDDDFGWLNTCDMEDVTKSVKAKVSSLEDMTRENLEEVVALEMFLEKMRFNDDSSE